MTSPFEFLIGRRYLFPRRLAASLPSAAGLLVLLSTLGVAVGVMVMILVTAVMSGAQRELENRLLGITPHVNLQRADGLIYDVPEVLHTVRETPGVTAATPWLHTQAMLRSAAGLHGAMLRSVDPETAGTVLPVLAGKGLKTLAAADDQENAAPAILLGSVLAEELKVAAGDSLALMLPGGDGNGRMVIPAVRRFRVAGIMSSGLHEFDKILAFISLKSARETLRLPNAASGIDIRLTSADAAAAIAGDLEKKLPDAFQARDWMRTNQNLFSSLRLQKQVMFLIMALIVLVAAFNIASSLIMMVMEKTRDIAILCAMGARRQQIRRIFIINGMLIGTAGTVLGLILGLGACAFLRRYPLIELPTDVYFFSALPLDPRLPDIAAIIVSALVLCFFSTLFPARKASRMTPLEALRYN